MANVLHILRSNWITGVGFGQLYIPITYFRNGHRVSQVFDEAKNLYLTTFAEFGFIGLALFLSIILIVRQCLDAVKSLQAKGLQSAWLAMLVAGLFDTPFGVWHNPPANTVVASLFGLTILALKPQETSKATQV